MRQLLIVIGLLVSLSGFSQNLLPGVVSSGGAESSDPPAYFDDAKAWWIADTAYITEEGDSIIKWEDASDYGNDLTPWSAFNTPTFAGDSVLLDGELSVLINSTALSIDTCTVYIVLSVENHNSGNDIISFGGTGMKIRQSTTTGKFQMLPSYINSDDIIYGQPGLLIVRYVENGESGIKWGTQDENTIADIGTITQSTIKLGLETDFCSEASIKEIVVTDRNDSSSEREAAALYFNNKYGL